MTNDELNEIVERVRQRIIEDPANEQSALMLLSMFEGMSAEDKEKTANVFGDAFWGIMRSRALNDAKQWVNVRWLEDGSEVTTDGSGTVVGLTGGKGQFDIANFLNAQLTINSASNARQVDIRSTGGLDCMADYIVSACWATEVSNGDGTEGQEFKTATGCTVKFYSTVQGACTDAATNFSGTKFAVIYICPGRYVELVSISSEVYIIGAGTSRLGTTLADTSGSSGVQIVHPPSIAASAVISVTGGNASGGKIMNLAVIGRSSADAEALIDLTGCTNFELESVSTVPGNAVNIGIKLGNPAQKVTNCASFNAGIGLQIISQSGNGREDQVHGFRSYSNTVGMDLQDGFHLISDFIIDLPATAGIQMRGSAAKCKLTDGIIFDAAEGIDVQDGTKFICDTVLFSGCTTGIGIDTSVDDDLQIVNCEFDLGTTGTGISFPATDTTDYAVIKGNRFWDSAGAGTPISNSPRGWAYMSDNWYNGGPLHASAVVNGGTLGVIRPSRETAREIEWDQFYILFGATLVTVAAGQLVLTASSANYVEVNSSGTVSANTTGFTAGQLPLYYADMATTGPFTVESRAPVLSHGGLASGTVAAPAGEPFVTHAASANLTNERVATAGSGIAITNAGTDGGALTWALAPLTALYDQSGAFNWVNRGGDLLIANSKDLKLYSDNSATPSTLTGEWDGATGFMGIGAAALTDSGLYIAPTFTAPAGVRYGAQVNPTFIHSGASALGHYGAYVVPSLEINAAATLSGSHHALGSGFILTDNSNGGTVSDVAAWSPIIATAGTVILTTGRAIHVHDALVLGGSIGTYYGIDIPVLSAATLSIGMRNLSTSRLVGAVTVGADAAVTAGLILDITGNAGIKNEGELRLYDSGSSNYIGIRSNNARTTDLVYVLPVTDPTAGQILSASAPVAGVVTLSWAADATGGGGGAHDHTTADGSGVLTNDEHDGYMNISAIATPSNPSAGAVRFFTRTSGNTIEVVAISATGDECIICTLINVAHTNTLALNWIQ